MMPALLTPDCLPAVDDETIPARVWDSLTTESRQRAVHLLAQLACTLATAPAALPHTESSYVHPAHHDQTPA